jgi:hypothetical protein
MQKFLKDLQDRYLLIFCFGGTMAIYVFAAQLDAILQLAINFAVAFIAIASKRSEQQTNITTETVETPSVTTQSIDHSVVNTETITNTGDPGSGGDITPKGEK